MDRPIYLDNLTRNRETLHNTTHPAVDMLENILKNNNPTDIEMLTRDFSTGESHSNMKEAATVLLDLRPTVWVPRDFSEWLKNRSDKYNPEFGSKFDSVNINSFGGNKEPTEMTFFVNKQLLIKIINDNPEVFSPAITYETALEEFKKIAKDPKQNDLAIGLALGYPKEDCQAWNNFRAKSAILGHTKPGGFDEALHSFGFSNIDIWLFKQAESYLRSFSDNNRFVNFIGLNHPLGIFFRRKLEELYRRIPGFSEDAIQYAMHQRTIGDSKYGTFSWMTRNEDSANQGKGIIKTVQIKIESSGMAKVFNKISALKRPGLAPHPI